MFTLENTTGYTQTELDELNAELEELLENVEPSSFESHEIEKQFSDAVARR